MIHFGGIIRPGFVERFFTIVTSGKSGHFFAIYKKYPAELAEWVDRCGTGRETA